MAEAGGVLGPYAATVERLGHRTAELHRALASGTTDPRFAPEPFSIFSQRSAYRRMRRLSVTVLEHLRTRAAEFDPGVRAAIRRLLPRRDEALARFQPLIRRSIAALRIGCHGNLHLGQVLHACDGDLVVIDFDGEPGRPLYERRIKQSPLHDVATMLRSFHYAGHGGLQQTWRSEPPRRSRRDDLRHLRVWQFAAGAVFTAGYREAIAGAGLLPEHEADAQLLLRAYVLERAVYEVGFELNRASRWIPAPLSDLPLLLR